MHEEAKSWKPHGSGGGLFGAPKYLQLKWALEGDENARQPELASVVERLRAAASDTSLFAPVAFELRGGWGSWDDLKAPCAGSQAS